MMIRKLSVLVAAACLFGASPYVGILGHVGGSLALLGLALLLALAASGSFNSLALTGGALGAFAGTVLGSVSPAVGGAVLVGLAFAERTVRVRTASSRLVHVGAAVAGGALAATLSSAYLFAPLAVRMVAVVVAGVLVALPLLVDADDPLAHVLEGTAALLPDPAKTSLVDGAELRRSVRDIPLDRDTAKHVQKTWQALLRLAEARVRLERTRSVRVMGGPSPAEAVVKMVDAKIGDHVTALSRAFAAVDTVHAAELGLDDLALKNVESTNESLDEVSRAMVDVKG
jgi:hypothetical protein